MEAKKDLSNYLRNMDTQNMELLETSLINDNYSNFRLFGIGKPTQKQIERKAVRVERRADEKKEFRQGNLGAKLKVIGRKLVRVNPVVAPMRAGALAGIRLNIFGIAIRLYPAFLTPEQARAKKISVDAIEPAKRAWAKVSKKWKSIGGNVTVLENTIKGAWNKPILKWTKKNKARVANGVDGNEYEYEFEYNNVTGAEEVASAISIGLPILTGIIALIKETKKNPLDKANPDLENVEVPEPTMSEEELDSLAKKDAENDVLNDDSDDKILGMPKTAFWIGVGAIALIGGFIVYKKFIAKK